MSFDSPHYEGASTLWAAGFYIDSSIDSIFVSIENSIACMTYISSLAFTPSSYLYSSL